MNSINKPGASMAYLKGYGIPQTLSHVEDRWCERVAQSIIDFRLKKEAELDAAASREAAQAEEEAISGDDGDDCEAAGGLEEYPLHRLNCDLEDLGEDKSDPKEGYAKGKHDILRVGYNPVCTQKWRNSTRKGKPNVVGRYRPTRKHKRVPSIKVDAPIDGQAVVKSSKGFGLGSKLPPIYKEMKSVMQPGLPTTGNDAKFKAIPKLVSYATDIWRQEEEALRQRESGSEGKSKDADADAAPPPPTTTEAPKDAPKDAPRTAPSRTRARRKHLLRKDKEEGKDAAEPPKSAGAAAPTAAAAAAAAARESQSSGATRSEERERRRRTRNRRNRLQGAASGDRGQAQK